jgi:DNA-binding IscR family transcriptional regulator
MPESWRARGSAGGWRLRRAPSEIRLSEIVRITDGPLAPFGDADALRTLIAGDADHCALYQVFLDVRDSAVKILDNTTIADIIAKRPGAKRKADRLPIGRKSAAK